MFKYRTWLPAKRFEFSGRTFYYLYIMTEWKLIVFFVFTLMLMGFFAGMEMAFYSANRLNIELKKKQGGTTSQLLARFVDGPASFLGNTLI